MLGSRVLAGMVLSAMTTATACSSGSAGPTTVAAPGPTTGAAAATAPATSRAVAEALVFEAPTVGGGRFVGANYAGRTVALWFWAPY